MKSQTMNRTSANPNAPRLSIGKALEKPIGCTQAIIANLKLTRLDIDRHNLVPVVWLNLKPDFGFIEGIAPLGKFFFTISGSSLVKPLLWRNCHEFDLAATCTLYFSLGS
jgi:hypothetical protein